MNGELWALITVAASVALIHTLTGPDHYVPFVVIGRAKSWPLPKTLGLTLLCGLGHVGSSIVLGLLGVAWGISIFHLGKTEAARGELAAWMLFLFGCSYTVWAVWRLLKGRSHSHSHLHADGTWHAHEHGHAGDHAHPHSGKGLTPWILFTIFIFGPCEPLIPLVMVPSARRSVFSLAMVSGIFALVTITTMLVAVISLSLGLHLFPVKRFYRYGHVLAGAALSVCGAGMLLLGW